MTGDQRGIGRGEVESVVGAVADDGVGGFTGLPGNGNDPEVRGNGDAADGVGPRPRPVDVVPLDRDEAGGAGNCQGAGLRAGGDDDLLCFQDGAVHGHLVGARHHTSLQRGTGAVLLRSPAVVDGARHVHRLGRLVDRRRRRRCSWRGC